MVSYEFILNIFRASDKTTYSYWIFWFLPTRDTRPFFLSQRVISMLEEISNVFVFIVVQCHLCAIFNGNNTMLLLMKPSVI